MQKAGKELTFITKKNILLFLLGLITIIIAFVLMAQPPVNGVLSRTVSPILLVIAYLIILPVAILAKDKKEDSQN